MLDLINRVRASAESDRVGPVFTNSEGNAYTAQAFKLGFNWLKKAARTAGRLVVNFTFHDLRSYDATEHKKKYGALPELHADPAPLRGCMTARK